MVLSHEWDVSRRLVRAPANRRPWWVSHPVPDQPPIELDAESGGALIVVRVSGEIDALTAPHLEAFVAGRSLAGCAVLELDLAGVTSIASAGLSALLELRRWCQQRGIELRLRGAQRSVWRVFELTGLHRVFPEGDGPAGPGPTQELALF
ncbi:anti-sigma factor antagonist [Geodermatophilus sp. SYSU D00815]